MHVINLNLLIRLRKTNQTKGETEQETEGKEEVQKEISTIETNNPPILLNTTVKRTNFDEGIATVSTPQPSPIAGPSYLSL